MTFWGALDPWPRITDLVVPVCGCVCAFCHFIYLFFFLHLSRPAWYLAWVLSALVVLVLPSTLLGLRQDTLLCNHCPMQHKAKPCAADVATPSTTRCLPDERCASSRGHYGLLHVLSGQGCLPAVLCGTHALQTHGGARYNVSHTCCCEDLCNHAPTVESPAYLKTRLGVKIGHNNVDNVDNENLKESVITANQEPSLDSCVNYKERAPSKVFIKS